MIPFYNEQVALPVSQRVMSHAFDQLTNLPIHGTLLLKHKRSTQALLQLQRSDHPDETRPLA